MSSSRNSRLADFSSFMGIQHAPEVKRMPALIYKIDQGSYRKILAWAAGTLEAVYGDDVNNNNDGGGSVGNGTKDDDDNDNDKTLLSSLQDRDAKIYNVLVQAALDNQITNPKVPMGIKYKKKELDEQDVGVLAIGTFFMLRGAIRSRTKGEIIEYQLIEDFRFPEEFVVDFVRIVKGIRESFQEQFLENKIHYPYLHNLKWRVDVTISSGTLARVLKPSVTMEMTMDNGDIQRFEMTPEKFQDLRYAVAKVLQNMQQVERHPILQIVDKSTK